MPIHLRVSRRRFLKGSAAALATASLSGFSRGAEAEESWAFLSDTHINADPKRRASGVVMANHLERAVGEVLTLPQSPAGVFVNGDMAHLRGETGDYQTFLNVIEPVLAKKLPLHLTMGNHDRRDRFCEATALGKLDMSPVEGRFLSILPARRVNWFLLDSLRETNETPGALGEEQVQWLGKMLDQYADKPAVILAHHNLRGGNKFRDSVETVIDVADRRLTPGGITDSDALLDTLATRPHVMAYIFGHTHQWNVMKWNGIYFMNLPPVAYRFLPEDPIGWVHCQSSTEGLAFKLNCFDAWHDRQGETLTMPWRTG